MDDNLFKLLGNVEFQNFLFANENLDTREFVLKHKDLFGIPSSIIANQLSGRRKAKYKLPSFYDTKGFVYPPIVNLEQCSSEATAQFKAKIIANHINKKPIKGVDLTGGLGIDSYFLSKICSSFQYVEKDENLFSLANYNHFLLNATNIKHRLTSAETYVQSTKEKFDFIYVDPSRRVNQSKVVRLSDCEPSVVALIPKLFEITETLLIKASPLLDLQQGTRDLQFVQNLFVISVDNECKEVLFLCEKGFGGVPSIHCVEITSSLPSLSFTFAEERNAVIDYSEPLNYLYEPNASMLKAGAFKIIAKKFGLKKLHVNTHLYTSLQLIENFPGRVFKIEKINPKESELKKYFPDGKANVATRNYPLNADGLKKKLTLKDGGERFLFGVTSERKVLMICKRIG